MGGGSYSYSSSSTRATSYANSSRQSVFTQRGLASEMNINGKIRESCDSDEHPASFPIIIALDMTGSMGEIPHELISGAFPEIMKSIMDAGVKDAQVCFIGVGDDTCDDVPIQCGQFETSDLLTEKWLKKLYIEGGGGGNYGESYGLAWYFAAHHTKIDSFDKRGIKGCLITIGDEPILDTYSNHSIKELFGNYQSSKDVEIKSLYNEVSKQWEVYHVDAGRGRLTNWDVLPSTHILKAGRDINSISKEIIGAILETYKKPAGSFSVSVEIPVEDDSTEPNLTFPGL